LTHITLRDFVIVRELAIELDSGFSALTGETGAGKSILIDAVQLALGARADAGVVREGASRCEVCVEFDTSAPLRQWLQTAGFADEDSLLLRRTVDSTGKSRAWINASPATATQLRELGELLLDIHGQHAWQSLTRPQAVRDLLDAYAGADTRPISVAWQAWRDAQQTLEQARAAQDSLSSERERLSWQIGELDKLHPLEGEWEDLNTRHSRLANAQSLIDAASRACGWLEGEEHEGALSQLGRAVQSLQELSAIELRFQDIANVLSSAQAQAEDAVHSLNAYLRKTDLDPQGLAQLDERLGLWLSLARRYRKPAEELPQVLAQWKAELSRLESAGDLAALEAKSTECHQAYLQAAHALSQLRRKAAGPLARSVTQAMQQLGMQGGRFEVELEPLQAPAAHGLEEVSFLVAGHAGSTPRPVGKVASGGELSRIALAIAVTTSELGEAGTLIFDEVDSGVGGAVAETVGRLMKQLGRHRQVLAVTHLPQVAACADHHLVVRKADFDGQVQSQLGRVTSEARVQEIARMLGGEKLSATTLAHAREMLQGADPAPSVQRRKAHS
jgi:DNA repair protein RecN (Recombination protein N)